MNVYFIDMELGDVTLADYIDYHRDGSSAINFEPNLFSNRTFIRKDSSLSKKMQNMWTIGCHISGGLEFMHSLELVHRDLKPSNSAVPNIGRLLIVTVLYCRQYKQWKLTDFGITAVATSQRARPTVYSRGTSSYRAPELLKEDPTFTNRTDIWSLGCVLYELVTSKNAFQHDWAVQQYDSNDSFPPISISTSEFLQHHVSENIRELLRRHPTQRPPASTLCRLYSSYCQILDLAMVEVFVKTQFYPLFSEWKQLVANHPLGPEFQYQLAVMYGKNGEEEIAFSLLLEIDWNHVLKREFSKPEHVTGVLERGSDNGSDEVGASVLRQLGNKLMKDRQYSEAITVYKAMLNHDPDSLSLRTCLQEIGIQNICHDPATRMYEIAVQLQPLDAELWRDFYQFHLGYEDFDSALEVSRQASTMCPGCGNLSIRTFLLESVVQNIK